MARRQRHQLLMVLGVKKAAMGCGGATHARTSNVHCRPRWLWRVALQPRQGLLLLLLLHLWLQRAPARTGMQWLLHRAAAAAAAAAAVATAREAARAAAAVTREPLLLLLLPATDCEAVGLVV
jgi:hypothetical protein